MSTQLSLLLAISERVAAVAAMRLEQGMGRKSRFGIWGGLTPTQRDTLDHTRQEGPTA